MHITDQTLTWLLQRTCDGKATVSEPNSAVYRAVCHLPLKTDVSITMLYLKHPRIQMDEVHISLNDINNGIWSE